MCFISVQQTYEHAGVFNKRINDAVNFIECNIKSKFRRSIKSHNKKIEDGWEHILLI